VGDNHNNNNFFTRSQALPALPGNAYLVALPPKICYRRQSRQACIPRQSPGTSKAFFEL